MSTIQHEKIDMTTTYQMRIGELNEIINDLSSKNSCLNKENDELKKQIESNSNSSLDLIKACIPKYTPYMVSNAIDERYLVKISIAYIVKTATKNNLFDDEFIALRIPTKKATSSKNNSPILFSALGVLKLIDILHEKFILNKNIEKDHFEIAFRQYREGKVKRYTMQELRDMEK